MYLYYFNAFSKGKIKYADEDQKQFTQTTDRYRSRGPGSIPGAAIFSEKQWV
jgi:hypothetical protein